MAFDYSNSFAGINSALSDLGKTLKDREDTRNVLKAFDQFAPLGQGAAPLASVGTAALPAPTTGASARDGAVRTVSDDTSDPLDAIMKFESGGRNVHQNVVPAGGGYNPSTGTVTGPSSASGYFQMINPTWRSAAAMAGIDTAKYPTAMSAPYEVQRAAAQALYNKEGFAPWAPYNARLRSYIAQRGGAGAFTPGDVRAASADAAAPGASYASAETGARGFFVPPGAQGQPAMVIDPNSNDAGSRTFLQSQAQGQTPLAALGTVPAPQATPQSAPMPPRRPADLVPSQPAQAAPAAGPAQSVNGDDPAKLRADAAYYEQTNPEAARQLRARADAVERSRGQPVQVAESEADVQRLESQMPGYGGPQPTQVAQANAPAPGAVEAQGFAVPGAAPATPQNTDRQMIRSLLSSPSTRAMGMQLWQQMATGKNFGFQVVGDQLYRTDPRNGTVEPVGVSKAPTPVTVGEGQTLVDPRTGQVIFKGQAKKDEAAVFDERRKQAAQSGMQPNDPGYQSYILTGKMPREDAQPLTATDKKAILEADEAVEAANGALGALRRAKELSPQAFGGAGASGRAVIVNNLPGEIVPDAWERGGRATAELDNLVGTNALSQLKAIFGGNPTEGERAIMMELQGSSSQPDAVRQKIYDRAIQMAERRLAFNQQRAKEMRGGDYYRPGGSRKAGEPAPQPQYREGQRASDGQRTIVRRNGQWVPE